MARAYSKCSHGIQRVTVDLCGYKREDEIRNTFNGVGQRVDDVIGDKLEKNIRADIERPEHCKRQAIRRDKPQATRKTNMRTRIPSGTEREQDTEDLSQQRRLAFI